MENIVKTIKGNTIFSLCLIGTKFALKGRYNTVPLMSWTYYIDIFPIDVCIYNASRYNGALYMSA